MSFSIIFVYNLNKNELVTNLLNVYHVIHLIDGSTARRCIVIVTNERRASYVIPLNSS